MRGGLAVLIARISWYQRDSGLFSHIDDGVFQAVEILVVGGAVTLFQVDYSVAVDGDGAVAGRQRQRGESDQTMRIYRFYKSFVFHSPTARRQYRMIGRGKL